MTAVDGASLERFIFGACKSYFSSRSWDPYDLKEGLRDLWRLSRHEDCCYDRRSIGLSYALWYQPRRVQDAYRVLQPSLVCEEPPTDLLDLGCGTGATIWALAIAASEGLVREPITVHAIDGSPFMLEAAAHLWTWLAAQTEFARARQLLDIRFLCGTWTQPLVTATTPWIMASYLFDDSDGQRVQDVADSLVRLAGYYQAPLLHVVATQGKSGIAGAVSGLFAQHGWTDTGRRLAPARWHGPAQSLQAIRKNAYAGLAGAPAWDQKVPSFGWSTAPLSLCLRAPQITKPQLPIGATPGVVLTTEQVAAAQLARRPAVVLGAAGSGKSRVLIERLVCSLDDSYRRRRSTRLLVTAFNKQLLDQLAEWLDARLRTTTLPEFRHHQNKSGDHTFHDRETGDFRVRMLNWDRIPTSVVKISPRHGDGDVRDAIAERVKSCASMLDAAAVSPRHRLRNPAFLEGEMHRVIWGLGCSTLDAYLRVSRKGRSTPLKQQQREIAWHLLMGPGHPDLFSHVRIRALATLRSTPFVPPFAEVLIDECQDFTPADFELAGHLVQDSRSLVAFGDEIQAMNLGPSYARPRTIAGQNNRKRQWLESRLQGSYRLPLRICEAVTPLADEISSRHKSSFDRADDPEDGVTPTATRSALLGIRPVVVAGNKQTIVGQINEVLEQFAPILATQAGSAFVTLAEGDDALRDGLSRQLPTGARLEVTSMKQIKGLERRCVVWSTGAAMESDDTLAETIYTVLTRTTTLLIIAVSETTRPEVVDVLRHLRLDRLLFWSEGAATAFANLRSAMALPAVTDDE